MFLHPPHTQSRLLLVLLVILVFILSGPPSLPGIWPRWFAMMMLTWWLPGVLLMLYWRLPELDLAAASLLAVGLGWCWMTLGGFVAHLLPGPINFWPLVSLYSVGILALGIGLWWRCPVAHISTSTSAWLWFVALLFTALLLRLPGLGYNEFHSDEVMVLTRAKEAINGEDDALARHTKGPGEIAIAAVVYRALGTATESTARLPFSLASVASVVALGVLGRRLFSPLVGLIAGILLATNGFALGLSRLVQYQPVVQLLTVLTLWAAYEFSARGQGRWLLLALVFGSFSVFFHYEFLVLAPLLLLLIWLGWRRASDRRTLVWTALATALAGILLVIAAYAPIIRNPYFAGTANYLAIRLGKFGNFNGAFFVEMGTFYNSIYYFVALIVLMLIGLWLGWRRARSRTALLAFWFLPFFVLYLFVMQFPGTHFYLLMPSWSILAALPVASVIQADKGRLATRWSTLILLALWLTVSTYYLYLIFFRQNPEYLVNYQSQRLPFYWAPYGANAPKKPRFGFPIVEGWKTLGVLAEWHYMGKTYASNERSRHLRWYLGEFERTEITESPDFVFVATHLQEPDPTYDERWLAGYQRVGEVRVRGEVRIAIWSRQPLPVSYTTYDAERFAAVFDAVVPTLYNWSPAAPQLRELPVTEKLTLVAAATDKTIFKRGETLHLRLDWLPKEALALDYKLFVHVATSDGHPQAQWDGLPGQNTARTSLWPVGEVFTDHVLVALPEAIPAGAYTLLAGLYDPATGDRLGNRAIAITTVTIE